ncbi:hypothetical protein CURTO8I2_220090 [Curtobacterium sp. 8I-2]|nr:hypothetical protein CURTO8I2_220090 [Curtobacterium sp. 8I-2]
MLGQARIDEAADVIVAVLLGREANR